MGTGTLTIEPSGNKQKKLGVSTCIKKVITFNEIHNIRNHKKIAKKLGIK